jgi:DNA-binding MarR family transcriptional regulator
MSITSRTHIGHLLLEAHRRFRQELVARTHDGGYPDLRVPHLHVFGNIDPKGNRLTELAQRAGLVPSAMLQIVDDLEKRGYLSREQDPSDRRAKLVRLTPEGRAAMRLTRQIISEMEADYAKIVGPERYDLMRETLDELGGSPTHE